MDADTLTMGYCRRCGAWTRGKPYAMIEDRAEAVDGHKGCPAIRRGTDGPEGRSGLAQS